MTTAMPHQGQSSACLKNDIFFAVQHKAKDAGVPGVSNVWYRIIYQYSTNPTKFPTTLFTHVDRFKQLQISILTSCPKNGEHHKCCFFTPGFLQ